MTVGQDAFESGRGVMATRKKNVPFSEKCLDKGIKKVEGRFPFWVVLMRPCYFTQVDDAI